MTNAESGGRSRNLALGTRTGEAVTSHAELPGGWTAEGVKVQYLPSLGRLDIRLGRLATSL